MRRFPGRTFTRSAAAALVATLLVAFASAPAGASVAAANGKFCRAISSAATEASKGATGVDQSNLKSVAATFRKAAKSAPGKVKSALKTLASKYAALGSAKGTAEQAKAALDLATDSGYRKAFQTFITYYTKSCATLSVPTT